VNGAPFNKNWSYPSLVGMLLYLAGNTRPDIACAMNQAARFTHPLKESHAKAIKKVVRCFPYSGQPMIGKLTATQIVIFVAFGVQRILVILWWPGPEPVTLSCWLDIPSFVDHNCNKRQISPQ